MKKMICAGMLLLFVGTSSGQYSYDNLEQRMRLMEDTYHYSHHAKYRSSIKPKELICIFGAIAGVGYSAYKIYSWYCMSVAPKRLRTMIEAEGSSSARGIVEMLLNSDDISLLYEAFSNSSWPHVRAVEILDYRINLYQEWIQWIYQNSVKKIDNDLSLCIRIAQGYIQDYKQIRQIIVSQQDYVRQLQEKKFDEISSELSLLKMGQTINNLNNVLNKRNR